MSELTDPTVLVFLKLKSQTTGRRRVLWRMTESDAKKVCSDPRTRNATSGLYWTPDDSPAHNRVIEDHGWYDHVLRDLGAKLLFPVLPKS